MAVLCNDKDPRSGSVPSCARLRRQRRAGFCPGTRIRHGLLVLGSECHYTERPSMAVPRSRQRRSRRSCAARTRACCAFAVSSTHARTHTKSLSAQRTAFIFQASQRANASKLARPENRENPRIIRGKIDEVELSTGHRSVDLISRSRRRDPRNRETSRKEVAIMSNQNTRIEMRFEGFRTQAVAARDSTSGRGCCLLKKPSPLPRG
jgi:NADPH-dependent glutamate synthase beta subunit-like oxidoreductase